MSTPIDELQRLLQSDTQSNVAEQLGISAQYLSDVLHKRRAPGKKILAALGLKRSVVYEKVNGKRK